ncbi:hypothetical protein B566_EDAN002135 [Ephemera danica]|nr:hypothetical protein B566_EDAN002135 [Ephemera danica]
MFRSSAPPTKPKAQSLCSRMSTAACGEARRGERSDSLQQQHLNHTAPHTTSRTAGYTGVHWLQLKDKMPPQRKKKSSDKDHKSGNASAAEESAENIDEMMITSQVSQIPLEGTYGKYYLFKLSPMLASFIGEARLPVTEIARRIFHYLMKNEGLWQIGEKVFICDQKLQQLYGKREVVVEEMIVGLQHHFCGYSDVI